MNFMNFGTKNVINMSKTESLKLIRIKNHVDLISEKI